MKISGSVKLKARLVRGGLSFEGHLMQVQMPVLVLQVDFGYPLQNAAERQWSLLMHFIVHLPPEHRYPEPQSELEVQHPDCLTQA